MSGECDDEGCVECFVEGDDVGYGEMVEVVMRMAVKVLVRVLIFAV